MKKLTWIILAILIVLAISLVFVFMKPVPQKTSAEKCFDDFNQSFVKANSTLLYPDFVRDCCAKPISEQASCLDQYGLLN
jgi:hypothetical protein